MNGTIQDFLIFRMNLQKRKDKFDTFRMSNNNVTISDTETENLSKKEETNYEITNYGDDLVSAVKSYTEKVKMGFFKKRVRRA